MPRPAPRSRFGLVRRPVFTSRKRERRATRPASFHSTVSPAAPGRRKDKPPHAPGQLSRQRVMPRPAPRSRFGLVGRPVLTSRNRQRRATRRASFHSTVSPAAPGRWKATPPHAPGQLSRQRVMPRPAPRSRFGLVGRPVLTSRKRQRRATPATAMHSPDQSRHVEIHSPCPALALPARCQPHARRSRYALPLPRSSARCSFTRSGRCLTASVSRRASPASRAG